MNSYTEALNQRLDTLSPGVSASLSEIGSLSPGVSQKVLCEILGYACQATHHSAIEAGRKAFAALPKLWLDENLDAGISANLNLEDYWEYARILELLTASYSALLPKYLQTGRSSTNADLREIAEDFAKPG